MAAALLSELLDERLRESGGLGVAAAALVEPMDVETDAAPGSLGASVAARDGAAGPPRAPAAACAPTRLARSARAVVGLGHTFRATDATTRSAAGSEMSRSSTRSSDERVSTSSAVRKLWPSSLDKVSTFRPATRASERCFAAIAKKRGAQPGRAVRAATPAPRV